MPVQNACILMKYKAWGELRICCGDVQEWNYTKKTVFLYSKAMRFGCCRRGAGKYTDRSRVVAKKPARGRRQGSGSPCVGLPSRSAFSGHVEGVPAWPDDTSEKANPNTGDCSRLRSTLTDLPAPWLRVTQKASPSMTTLNGSSTRNLPQRAGRDPPRRRPGPRNWSGPSYHRKNLLLQSGRHRSNQTGPHDKFEVHRT